MNKKNTKFFSKTQRNTLVSLLVLLVVVAAVVPLLNRLRPSHAASSTSLSLSPATQSVTAGSDVVITVTYNPGGASILSAQSVLTYNAANFSLVSVTPGSAFGEFPTPVESAGSVQFEAGTTTPVTTTQTVATVTLLATGVGTSSVSLASVCPANDYALTCSAVYDSVNSDNDLGSVVGASYTVSPIVPTQPTGLNKTGVTTTTASMAWTASTETGGPGVAGYNIFRNGTKVNTSATTTFTDTGLTPGTSYSYTVQAYDSGTPQQVSPQSTALPITTTQVTPTAPTAVTKNITTSTFNTIILNWTASTDIGGPGLTGYAIYENGSTTELGTSTTNSYTVTGLTPNTVYSFVVKAYDKDNVYSSGGSLSTNSNIIGDLDGDGVVTTHDLNILLNNFGTNYPPAEFDPGNNIVETHDLNLLSANIGQSAV